MQFETYFDATEVAKKAKKTQAAILLTIAGAEALDIFQTFAFGEGEGKEELLSIWADVFKGIGLYQREYHIRLWMTPRHR